MDAIGDLVANIDRTRTFAAGEPSKTTSNYCIASACNSSAKLHTWLARQIFCKAYMEPKVEMSEQMTIPGRIRGEMLDDMCQN